MFVAGLLALALGVAGCAAPRLTEPGPAFVFPEETFSFANELVSDYEPDPDGRLRMVPRSVSTQYRQNCVAMSRATRLIHAHARFDPGLPRAGEATYRELFEILMSRDPRKKRPVADRIVIPGYPNLYAFSRDEETLLKAVIGSRWGAYFQRGNWRMILPFTRSQQSGMAERLLASLHRGEPPVVHVVRFPAIDINHTVFVYGAEETPDEIWFDFYDPNYPDVRRRMRYDRVRKTFEYPESDFFAGGPVRAYEVYDGLFY
ncbi:MAG: hypothetical protein QF890_14695 [Myxococcota bacterium]|nr:hypothetical protein [Deltaproteobacteria bacterium]MDP6244618.1 hypothetical protein [Myxococcota bacterium]MDP7075758.1 hypothetical protein [Myxococcota bacterium]MDP7299931.1 hypothetical protein [Myxococcota bacterium]MDP7433807.1 hypothetical protein [Myxococcota bacterium]